MSKFKIIFITVFVANYLTGLIFVNGSPFSGEVNSAEPNDVSPLFFFPDSWSEECSCECSSKKNKLKKSTKIKREVPPEVTTEDDFVKMSLQLVKNEMKQLCEMDFEYSIGVDPNVKEIVNVLCEESSFETTAGKLRLGMLTLIKWLLKMLITMIEKIEGGLSEN